jgi:pyruvate dehydrogenase E2 component (dihydrolipoamide acetyltransferase)
MATQVEMPKMGYDMTEGTILSWRKAEGDTVAKGDVLGEIETGKVTIEIEAFNAGILRKILVAAGETVPVGSAIAIIGTADEAIELPAATAPAPSMNGSAVEVATAAPATSTVPAAADAAADATAPTASTPSTASAAAPYAPPTAPADAADAAASTASAPSAASATTAPDARLRASPLARRLAKDHNIPLTAVAGTGPNSRIIRDDVLAAIESSVTAPAPAIAPTDVATTAPTSTAPLPAVAAAPEQAEGEDIREPLTAMRRTIARRLTESWTAAPHIFLTMPIQMDAALALRKQINTTLEASGVKVSVNDLIVKAAARALRVHPRVNVSWDDGTRIVHTRVNIGVAVALDDGLITLTVPDADLRPLSAIAAELVDKAGRARAGKLQPADLATPSSFTVTNLGMYGIEDFTAIINPPEAAILAIGAAAPTPVVEDGAVVVRTLMRVTLSADHRVVDGAAAAEFLVTLKGLLEQPLGMLV